MTNPDDLRRMAEAHGKQKFSEYQKRENLIGSWAARDLEAWRKNIEATIKKNGPRHIMLFANDGNPASDNRGKAPYGDTNWCVVGYDYEVRTYAGELQKLLGEPFTVEVSDLHLDATLDCPSQHIRTFTVGW